MGSPCISWPSSHFPRPPHDLSRGGAPQGVDSRSLDVSAVCRIDAETNCSIRQGVGPLVICSLSSPTLMTTPARRLQSEGGQLSAVGSRCSKSKRFENSDGGSAP